MGEVPRSVETGGRHPPGTALRVPQELPAGHPGGAEHPCVAARAQRLEQKARRILVESLYWTQNDEEALQEAARLSNPDPEVLLFRGVSSLRLSLPDAHDLLLRLFLQQRVSTLHGRVFTFLAGDPKYRELFTDLEWDLINAKNDFLLQEWDAGIPLMESVIQRLDPATVAASALVADLAGACQAAGAQSAGARFLERMSARLPGRARADAMEQAGRLYRRARAYPQAIAVLRAAVSASADADQRDRARWQILDILITLHPSDLPALVEKESADWSNPASFTDLLESWISDLVAAKKWATVARLWAMVQTRGPADVDARLSYILARVVQEGLIKRVPGAPPVSPHELFTEAASKDSDGYYGIMASILLGQIPPQLVPRAESGATEPPPPLDPLITGFLPFGLSSQAYQRIIDSRRSLSDAQVLAAARLFSQVDDHASSMHLMGLLSQRRALSEDELKLEYPQAYGSVIDELARETGIKGSVLYGLVREESFFDPDIVSSAGAVGLSQLIPATASSVARALHLSEPDLRGPGDQPRHRGAASAGSAVECQQHPQGAFVLQRGAHAGEGVGEGGRWNTGRPFRGSSAIR